MVDDRALLCGRCNVRLHVSAEARGDPIVCCPVCGERDTLQNALREAGRHVAYKLLSRMLRHPDSELSALDAEQRPTLHFRFVEDGG